MSKSQHKNSESGGKHKKRHRKFVSFRHAMQTVRECGLQSRKQYWDWIDHNGIAYMPKQPNRVYKDWVSWSAFLGTNNVWEANGYTPGNYRPYWDAVRWSQKVAVANKITTMKEWLKWYGENDVPDNIPKRPDAYYDEWKGNGWGTWLGTTIKGKIMTEKMAHGILALVVQKGHAKNVVTMRLEKGGPDALEDAWRSAKEIDQEFQVLKMFEYNPDHYMKLKGIYEMCSTPFEGNDQVRLVQNLPTFLWEVESVFDAVT